MSEQGLMTAEEAAKWVAAYEHDRCACGGSPPWLDQDRQVHLTTCRALAPTGAGGETP